MSVIGVKKSNIERLMAPDSRKEIVESSRRWFYFHLGVALICFVGMFVIVHRNLHPEFPLVYFKASLEQVLGLGDLGLERGHLVALLRDRVGERRLDVRLQLRDLPTLGGLCLGTAGSTSIARAWACRYPK